MQFLQKNAYRVNLSTLFEIELNGPLTFSDFLENFRAGWLYGDFKLNRVISQRYVYINYALSAKLTKIYSLYQTYSRIKPMAGLLSRLLSFTIELQNCFVVFPVQKQWRGCVLYSATGVFLWTYGNCQQHLFWRTSANDCFCPPLFGLCFQRLIILEM